MKILHETYSRLNNNTHDQELIFHEKKDKKYFLSHTRYYKSSNLKSAVRCIYCMCLWFKLYLTTQGKIFFFNIP